MRDFVDWPDANNQAAFHIHRHVISTWMTRTSLVSKQKRSEFGWSGPTCFWTSLRSSERRPLRPERGIARIMRLPRRPDCSRLSA